MDENLVLLRHGESAWNRENRFTGWTDVDLTARGVAEAHTAAARLATTGIVFDAAFTSVLRRAIRTLWIVLDDLDQMWVPVTGSWRLNERHYGALQGEHKGETAERLGRDRVYAWRRSFEVLPPPLALDDPRHPRFDPRYAGIDPALLPRSESLQDTLVRLLPLWTGAILPRVQAGERVLIVAHGNSLRALVTYLERIPPAAVPDLHIPTGVPYLYTLGADGRCARRRVLED